MRGGIVIMLLWELPKEGTVVGSVMILSPNPFSYRAGGSNSQWPENTRFYCSGSSAPGLPISVLFLSSSPVSCSLFPPSFIRACGRGDHWKLLILNTEPKSHVSKVFSLLEVSRIPVVMSSIWGCVAEYSDSVNT